MGCMHCFALVLHSRQMITFITMLHLHLLPVQISKWHWECPDFKPPDAPIPGGKVSTFTTLRGVLPQAVTGCVCTCVCVCVCGWVGDR